MDGCSKNTEPPFSVNLIFTNFVGSPSHPPEANGILDLLGHGTAPAPAATPDSVAEAFEQIASVAAGLRRPNVRPQWVQGCHEIIQLCRKIEQILQGANPSIDLAVVSGSWAPKILNYIVSF